MSKELSSAQSEEVVAHERRAAIILDGMKQFVALLNPAGDILEVNRAALEGSGQRIEEIRGKPFWTARWWQVSEQIREDLKVAIRRAAAGEFVRYEVDIYGGQAGFDPITIDFSLQPLRGATGEVEYLLPEGTNISERKRTEEEAARFRRETAEEVRLRTTQFETLLHQAPMAVFLVDADFRLREVNPVALTVFGDIPGGVVGRDLDEILHIIWEEQYADDIVRMFQHTTGTGESYIVPSWTGYRADRGVAESYEWRLDRILLPDGCLGAVCYFRDISERKRAEHNANLLASIVESSDDAIVSKNLNGVILSWNRGAERLFGYTAAEVVGQSIAIIIPPDRLDEEPKILERLKRGERVDHFETIRVRKDGSPLNISLTISPVKDADGHIVGASKIARDNTERRRQEEALRQANIDLQQFAYSASHDLQEPLRMVSIYSELLKEQFGEKLGPTGAEYISHTAQGAVRMEKLLRDLRSYTQVSASANEPAEDIDAGEVLQKTLANFEAVISDTGAEIDHTDLPTIRMREFQLEQVFQNLIGNALRYRSRDNPRIHVAATRQGMEWLFSVRDNGIGIAPEFKEQVFGIFKRLHTASEYPGTGMGLAICQRVIERVGGRIWVESEPGRGSTFFFTVPCRHPGSTQDSAAQLFGL